MTDEEFCRLYNNAEVKIETIARKMGYSPATVRSRASRLGFAKRRQPTRTPAPLCDDEPPEELQQLITRRIERRAAAVRKKWDDQTEKSRRVTKGTLRWQMPCFAENGDHTVYVAGRLPVFMATELRTEDQIYSDRKKQAAKEAAARINNHQEGYGSS